MAPNACWKNWIFKQIACPSGLQLKFVKWQHYESSSEEMESSRGQMTGVWSASKPAPAVIKCLWLPASSNFNCSRIQRPFCHKSLDSTKKKVFFKSEKLTWTSFSGSQNVWENQLQHARKGRESTDLTPQAEFWRWILYKPYELNRIKGGPTFATFLFMKTLNIILKILISFILRSMEDYSIPTDIRRDFVLDFVSHWI